jgi:riboflavin synthase
VFTGIIEEIGKVERVERRGGGGRLRIKAKKVVESLEVGDSIAVNGVCLTVTETHPPALEAMFVRETAARTTVGMLRAGTSVNLERSLRPIDRLGGHFVQGHVDGVGKVISVRQLPLGLKISIEPPSGLQCYMIPKGSVAIDGVSLTITGAEDSTLTVYIIPHTAQVTTLGRLRAGDRVNVEADMLVKHIHHLLKSASKTSPQTDEV